MKLKKIFLLLILVLLLVGVSYAAEATNDTTTASDTHQVLKESSTTTDSVDTSIKQGNSINKEIKKQTNENKTTKTASKNYEVTDYNTLHNALTTGTYDTVTININSDITLTGSTTLNKSITSLTINGNGKTINGDDKYQFLYIASYGDVNISNLKITNCNGANGGAISHSRSTLTITNTTFNNNTSINYGGAIYIHGSTLKIINSSFNNNTASNGGAIYQYVGNIIINNTTFNNNRATSYTSGAIYSYAGNLAIYNSALVNNTAATKGGAITNYDGKVIIYNCTFNKNFASENYSQDICNEGRILIIKQHFSTTDKTILNSGLIQIYNESKTIEENIYNNGGKIFLLGKLNKNQKNFTYLNQLIHSGQKEIQIKEDIILEEGEEEEFIDGITIDENDIIIDGNGHTINAKGDMIFNIIGNNIRIKNIKIVNGYGDIGGAISNNDTLSITNSTFNNNTASKGGAIHNYNTLTIINTTFNNNTALEDGGAISNYNTLTIINTTFNNNKAEYSGGAIINSKTLNITNITFNNNKAKYGGAISGGSTIKITNSTFNNNKAEYGGAISAAGTLNITNTTFNNNTAKEYGGAIYKYLGGSIITNSTFNYNTASKGGAIHNYNRNTLNITNTIFNNNIAKYNGAAISNEAILTVINNTFNNNRANTTGKAIINEGKATITNNTNSETSKRSSTIYTNAIEVTITNNIFDDRLIKTKISITLNNPQLYINDTIELTFTLKYEDNKTLTNKKITTTINGERYILTTNTEGIATQTYKATTYGTYKITATYEGSETNAPAFNTSSIYVKPYTWIKIGYNGYVNKGSTVKILARILNNTTAVKYVPVYVTIDNKTYKIKSDGAGYIRLNYTVEDYNDHKIIFQFKGNSKYQAVKNSTTLKVIKPTEVLMAKMTNVPYGYNVKVVGRLMQDDNPIKYVLVNVTINDKEYTLKTDGAGYFRTNYTVDNYDEQKITFKFNGNDKYLASSNSTTFKVKIPTKILMAKMTNVPYGYNVKVVGRLMQDDNPIKYVSVNVTINDKEYTLKTDGAGYFRINYTVDNYDIQIITFKFKGSNKYWASSNSTFFKVKQPTWIKHATIDTVEEGSTIKIVGRVLYNQTSSVKYVPVNVTLNNNVYTLKTNGAGYYSLNYTATDIGTITFTTIFNGNKLYLNSTNSTNFTVVKS